MDEKLKKHILHQLKGKSFSGEVVNEIKRNAKELFDTFLEVLQSKDYSENQRVHAINILFDLCGREILGWHEKPFKVYVELIGEERNTLVASAAFFVIVRMMITNKVSPQYYPIDKELLNKACNIFSNMESYSLDEKSRKYAKKCQQRYLLCEI